MRPRDHRTLNRAYVVLDVVTVAMALAAVCGGIVVVSAISGGWQP